MVRVSGYVKKIEDLERIPVMTGKQRHARAAARRRRGADRSRDASRHRRTRRRGRGGGRRDRDAQWRERARDDRARQGQARGAAQRPAGGRRDRHDLRPLLADPARRGQSQAQAGRRVDRRGAGVLRVPVPPALEPDRRDRHADRGALGVHRDAPAGHQREHHVARRHRHRDRHAGGRRDRDDRERAQETRAWRRRRTRTDGRGIRGMPGGRAVAVLLADDRRVVIPSGVHARGPGGPAVRAARVHQDLRHALGVAALDHAGAGAHLLAGARQHPSRTRQPREPRDHGSVPAVPRSRAACALDRGAGGDRARAGDAVAGVAARHRVHAGTRRGRPAVHADHAAGSFDRRGTFAAAADRQADPHRARGGAGVRQGRSRRDRPPILPRSRCSRRPSS